MTKKIVQYIMLVAGVVLSASLFVIMGCLYDYFGSIEQTQLENQLGLAARGVEESGMEYLQGLDGTKYRLTWVGPDGAVLYDTQADPGEMENHGNREEIKQAFINAEGKSSRYSATLLEKTLYYAQRLSDGSVLRISVSRATAWMLALGMLQPILIILLAALALSGVLAGRMSRRIVEPLNRLNLDMPLENETYEELAPLLSRIDRQRKQINAQLRELQRKNDEFSQVTQNMTEGLVLLSEKNTVLSINPAAAKLFHTNRDIKGKDFLTIERSREISRAIQTAFADGHSEICVERDGREYQLDISRIESKGVAIGAVLLAFDITEQAFSERNRREFTANVSHELKTPLQSIMGSAELIENGMVKQEDLPRFVNHIRIEAERLVALINDIIRLSQLDEGGELPYEDIDLMEIAKEAAATLQEAAAAKNVTITVTGEASPIHSIRGLLTEIVYNLCDNAVKYNVDGGSVKITVSGRTIAVQDTGIGIPAEHQNRVFERFYRVDKSHSKASGGTGLGLSIVKHAVGYLGGRIELESEPGKGTVIKIIL